MSADSGNTSVARDYQPPALQFNPLQEKAIVREALSPEIEEEGAKSGFKRTFTNSTASSIIPVGSIIYYSKEGITTVFDQTGTQILSADDSQAEMIPTPVGLIPATHVHTVPSGSNSYVSGNATYIVYNNTIVYITIHEKIDSGENPEGVSYSKESSTFSTESPYAQRSETDIINTTVMASAVVDNPDFHPGDTFTTQWVVPDSPRQTGDYSPAYLSVGINEENIYNSWLTRHNLKLIIEYDYDQNTWFMTGCSFERYKLGNWYMTCVQKSPINNGDRIGGWIEYHDLGGTPPYHEIYVLMGDYNTGVAPNLRTSYPVDTDTISQLNLIMQGDLEKLDESTIIGNATFSPVNFPASPTTYVAASNTQLPHLSVENNWPDSIVFRTRTETMPELKTFSTTDAVDPEGINGQGNQTVSLIEDRLQKLGWTLKFSLHDPEVTKESLGINGNIPEKNLNHATLHWHVGHGGDDGHLWLRENGDLFPSDVAGKWGYQNKWVVLDSCSALKNDNWKDALNGTHGILGFTTISYVRPTFAKKFFDYAIEDKKTIVSAFKNACVDEYMDQDVPKYLLPNGTPDETGTREPLFARVIFASDDMFLNDHLPGSGAIAADTVHEPKNAVMRPIQCTNGRNE